MNARGDTIAVHLQDVPNRVREVAGHGVHQRRRRRPCRSADIVRERPPNPASDLFSAGEAREEFEELVEELDAVAIAITEEVSLDAVVYNVLADD